jgi:predicted murein hydrolase (TIGR00659 family)
VTAILYPIFAVAVTIGVWLVAVRVRRQSGTPLLDPVLLSMGTIIALLLLFDIPYGNYEAGGRIISFFLGPAVVALAVPFYRQLGRVRKDFRAVLGSVGVGSVVGIVSASGLGYLLGGTPESVISLAPKSVTTPIAMELSAMLGGTPPLTIAIVVLTGILGGMLGPQIVRLLGVKNEFAQGLAIGTAAHGIGTARALREGELMGAMSGIGMTLNGVITAILLALLALYL